MKNKDTAIIMKILNYILELKEFIKDYSKEDFNKDRKTINACVFDLSQIGELAGKISKELIIQEPKIEWQGLKSLRNRIVHDYEGINLNMIWEFLSNELNELEEDLTKILSKKI